MFNSKFILGFIFFVFCILLSCKKHETLPELDSLGNDMNPKSGTEYIKLDSSRVYTTGLGKYLKGYISIDPAPIYNMGFTWSQVNVYRNGSFATFYNSVSTHMNFTYSVVSGQVVKLEFTVLDGKGRESKKSKAFYVTIP